MSKTPAPYNAGLCVVCQADRGTDHHPECPVGLVEGATLRAVIYKEMDGHDYPDWWAPETFPDLEKPGDGWDVYSPAMYSLNTGSVGSFGQCLGRHMAESHRSRSLYGDRKVAPEEGLPLEMVFLPPPSVREPATKAYWEEHNKVVGNREKLVARQKLEVLIRNTEAQHGALADKYERDKPGLNDYGKSLREKELSDMADQIVALRRDLDKLNQEIGK